MEQRDYLLRQFSQLGLVLAEMLQTLLGLKSGGQTSIGIEMVSQTLKEELKFDLQGVINTPPDVFISTLMSQLQPSISDLNQLAHILLLLAESSQGEQKRVLYKRCLILYEHLASAEEMFSFDRQMKIEHIRTLLNTTPEP